MSRRIPVLAGRERPANLAVLMREAFVAINDLVIARLAERGHGDVRPAHAAVFQYLDDTGTTVSVLAERAQMTKQAMAELVRHLEEHGYLVRVPDRPTSGPSSSCPPTAGATSSRSPRPSCPRWRRWCPISWVPTAYSPSAPTSTPSGTRSPRPSRSDPR